MKPWQERVQRSHSNLRRGEAEGETSEQSQRLQKHDRRWLKDIQKRRTRSFVALEEEV